MTGPQRRVLSGWGRTAPSAAHVVSVASAGDVARAVRTTGRRGVIGRGLGRSYGDAAQDAGGRVIDMTGLSDEPFGHPDVTGRLRIPAGMSFEHLLGDLVPAGWFPPVCPGTRHVTLGGAVAADVHGKNHRRHGSLSRHVSELRLTLADGSEHIVGPDRDPDAFAATTGGMGLTGVVTEVALSMTPIETSSMSVDTDRTDCLDATLDQLDAASDRRQYAVAWLDLLSTGRATGRGVVTSADHAIVDELPAERRDRPLDYRSPRTLSARWWPNIGVVNQVTARALGETTWRRAPVRSRRVLTSIPGFFHPLDALSHWNRLHGRAGFVQYQFAVPDTGVEVIGGVIGGLQRQRIPAIVGVLKRFGPGTGAPLSFPIEGWTLSVDVPAAADGLGPLLDAFDEEVADAGGRVYLAKDGRLRRELLETMYPDLPRWREVRDRLDPERRLQSDLARRLRLVEVP